MYNIVSVNDVTFEDNYVTATRCLGNTFANDNNQHAVNPITKNE